jgi:hypothetical protein
MNRRILKPSCPENTPFLHLQPRLKERFRHERHEDGSYLILQERSPLRSIREKCIDCCGGNKAEVARCQIQACALWPFRMGRNPNRGGCWGNARLSLRYETSLKRTPPKKDTPAGTVFIITSREGLVKSSKDGKPVTVVSFRGRYHVRICDASFKV